jgi:hypothetical protein
MQMTRNPIMMTWTAGVQRKWAAVAAPDAAFDYLPFVVEQSGRNFRPRRWNVGF